MGVTAENRWLSICAPEGHVDSVYHLMVKTPPFVLSACAVLLSLTKDLVQGSRTDDSKGHSQQHTSTQQTTGYTVSLCTVNSTDTFSSWGAQDDTAIVKATAVCMVGREHIDINQARFRRSHHDDYVCMVDPVIPYGTHERT